MFWFFNLVIINLDNKSEKCLHLFNLFISLTILSEQMTAD